MAFITTDYFTITMADDKYYEPRISKTGNVVAGFSALCAIMIILYFVWSSKHSDYI